MAVDHVRNMIFLHISFVIVIFFDVKLQRLSDIAAYNVELSRLGHFPTFSPKLPHD